MMQSALPMFVGEVTAEGGGQISLPPGGVRKLGWAPGDELVAQVVGDDVLLVLRRPRLPLSDGPMISGVAELLPLGNHSARSEPARLPIISGAADPASDPTSRRRTDGVAAVPGTAAEQPLDDRHVSDPAANAVAQLERLERRIAALERLLARIEAVEQAGEETAEAPSAGASEGPGEETHEGAAPTASAGGRAVETQGTNDEGEKASDPDATARSEKKPSGLHLGEEDEPAELILRLPKAKQFMRELARDILAQMLPDDTTIRWR